MSHVAPKALEWTMGLRNAADGRYLTQETFGFAINCNGKSLKKKQTFTLIAKDGAVHLRTHLGKFMYGDRDGNVKGDAEAPSGETEWTIVPQPDGTWGLKSAAGFFFHGTAENLRAFTGGEDVPADGKWVVHLAMHPQINLYSIMRKRYVHLHDNELKCDEDVPWGEDALLNLIFFNDHPCGRYGIMASNGLFLENSGKLVSSANANCYFLLGFHDDAISLCDDSGRFLSCVGGDGLLKVNKSKVTRDELFKIQDSEPQFTMRNLSRGTKGQVSARNGSEVKADQADVQDSERFQFEVADGKVHILTNKLFYWAPRDDGSIGAVADKRSAATAFVIDYTGGNTIRIKHEASGRNVYSKPHGGLFANDAAHEDDAELFELTIINRPTLVLRGQYGFLGVKGASGRVECNRSTGDVFQLEAKGGEYYLRTQDRKYWTVDRDGVAAVSSAPVAFFFEFVQHSKALIRHKETGMLLQGEQSGGFTASGSAENINTLWEY